MPAQVALLDQFCPRDLAESPRRPRLERVGSIERHLLGERCELLGLLGHRLELLTCVFRCQLHEFRGRLHARQFLGIGESGTGC